ncbi:MAG: amidase family protein [Acidobacteria bacterium]|nr:amidase family protein [Acidobacteriota bacterium]
MKSIFFMFLLSVVAVGVCRAQEPRFHLEEATIADVHRAIQQGEITCQGLVQAYINRARAYNGVSNRLVTENMASDLLPNYSEYKAAVEATADLPPGDPRKTPPIEFGRMEPTASDPSVEQQFGMTVGIPNAGQLRALGTLNIRGERSVTCKAQCDRKDGRPGECPRVCSEFSRQPDALERAAELDTQYGRLPDLDQLPLYCIPFSLKDPFDTKDMRSTSGADARYDIDFPARDHTLVAQLRKKGAIIYAKANNSEYNGRASGNPGGANFRTKVLPSTVGYQRSTWAGNPSNVYDTTRAASLGSSSGSGVSVSANMTMCSLCEETNRSCRGPANHSAVALILPHKALLSFHGGAIGADVYNDRAGIHCRTLTDAAKVLDALKDTDAKDGAGYYDPRDIFTTVPRSSVLAEPYSQAIQDGREGALSGMRIGIVREFMVKHAQADEPIVDAAAAEMKNVIGAHLGATLVESVTPGWVDDPEIENMSPSFDRAIAEILPILYPDLLFHLTSNQEPKYPAFAARIEPTLFAPGVTKGTGTLQPVDWMLRWAEGLEPTPPNLTLRSILSRSFSRTFRFHVEQYLTRRAEDWAERGYTETLVDWPTLNARSKFYSDDLRVAFKNWEGVGDLRNPLTARQGIAERIQLRELLRRVILKVIQENKLDILINVHSTLPPGRIGLAPEPVVNDRAVSYALGPSAGITEVLIPAGYVRTAYDPAFELATDANGRKFYRGRTSTAPTALPAPGLPFSISFWAEPGMEPLILKAASAYEAASQRRARPPAFGPLPGEP